MAAKKSGKPKASAQSAAKASKHAIPKKPSPKAKAAAKRTLPRREQKACDDQNSL